MARLSGLVLALMLSTAMGGCTSIGGDRASDDAAFSVGENLLGEPCRVDAVPADALPAGALTGSDVFCGDWEQPSGEILDADGGIDPLALAENGWWRQRLNSFLSCQPPQPTTILNGVEAVGLDCSLQRGGWPYQAIAARVDGRLYLGESIPAALPALERAIGALSGRLDRQQAVETGTDSAEIARLEARLKKASYSVGDLQTYYDLLRLAQYYNYQGNHAEAERRYRDALSLLQKSETVDNDGTAFVLMSLALELSNQERFDEATALFQRAETLLPSTIDPTLDPQLTSYRAIHLANQRLYGDAAVLARKASQRRLELAQQFRPAGAGAELAATPTSGPGRRLTDAQVLVVGNAEVAYSNVVQSRYIEASMLARDDKLDEAEAALVEAVAVFNSDPEIPRRWLPEIQIVQAEIAMQRGDPGRAERLLAEAIDRQRALFFASRSEGIARLRLAAVYEAQGRAKEARDEYAIAFAIFHQRGEGLRFSQALPYFRVVLAEAKRDPQRRQELFAEMFEVAQLIRGTVIAQTINLTVARLAASDQEAGHLIRELQDMRQQRDALSQATTRAQADPATLPMQLEQMTRQQTALSAQIAELERRVQAAAPRYNQLIDTPVASDDVRQVLQPGEAVYSILLGRSGSIALFVDRDGIEVYEVPLTEPEARRIVAEVRQPFDAKYGSRFDTAKANQLYQRLFAPIAAPLASIKHLIVVPSGPLLSLPFALLVKQDRPGDVRYEDVAWMIRDHALTVAPSVQSLVNLRKTVQPSKARQPMVGFGNFVPNRDVDMLLARRNLPASCREEMLTVANAPALPGTAAEMRSVARTVGASEQSIILGQSFTETAVKTMPLDDFRIIYFATHGLLPQQLNCWSEPSLLTSKPGVGETDDGLLVASEIIELKLDADLVVLSACNTGGAGEQSGGESLSGLARAFFYAGARSLMVTHWEIPDEPTVDLMVQAFEGFARRGQGEAEALRAGQLSLLSNPRTSHPVNWAAFTLVGEGGRRLQVAETGARP